MIFLGKGPLFMMWAAGIIFLLCTLVQGRLKIKAVSSLMLTIFTVGVAVAIATNGEGVYGPKGLVQRIIMVLAVAVLAGFIAWAIYHASASGIAKAALSFAYSTGFLLFVALLTHAFAGYYFDTEPELGRLLEGLTLVFQGVASLTLLGVGGCLIYGAIGRFLTWREARAEEKREAAKAAAKKEDEKEPATP